MRRIRFSRETCNGNSDGPTRDPQPSDGLLRDVDGADLVRARLPSAPDVLGRLRASAHQSPPSDSLELDSGASVSGCSVFTSAVDSALPASFEASAPLDSPCSSSPC